MFQKVDLFLAPAMLGLLERANLSCWTAHVIWSGKLLLALDSTLILCWVSHSTHDQLASM
jgi:hypothetical protein